MSCHESEEASPDPGAVPPVDPPRTAEHGRLRAASGSGTGALHSPLAKPERALAKDATDQARQLKRKHRALYTADARRFRRIARAAQSTVFRQKPGSKPDRQAARRISRAARKHYTDALITLRT